MEQALDPRPLLLKRMIWDTFPHDFDMIREAQADLGLVPDRDEGLDVGHSEAAARAALIYPLVPTLRDLSGLATEAVLALFGGGCDCADADDDSVECDFTEQTAAVVFESSYAIISALLSNGILVHGGQVYS